MKFTDATKLREEVLAGYANQRSANEVQRKILESLISMSFSIKGVTQPENRAYSYVTRMTPKLVSDRPMADVTHAGGMEERKSAALMSAGTNEWIVKTKHARLLERMVPYVLSGRGMTLTTLQKVAGWNDNEDEVTNPNLIVIEPEDCTWDPYASTWDNKRWASHKYARDFDELVGHATAHPEEKWDLEAIHACAVDVGLDELARSKNVQNVPKRREVVLQDVWCKGEDGSSGYLYTIGVNSNGNGEFLREERNFFGPRGGPYTLWGCYSVPGYSMPMAPLAAVWPVIEELNAFAVVLADAARKGKTVGISGLSEQETTLIHNAKDFDTVRAPGYVEGKNFGVAAFGYITRERLDYRAILSDHVDRILGMDDADRGKVTGIGTATEVATAASATNEITGFVAQRFRECAENALMSVLWYLYHESTVAFDLSLKDSDREKMGVDRVRYRGGAPKGQKLAPFDGYVLEITQYSMQRMSEAKMRQRSNDLIQLFAQLPLVQQIAPYVDVEEYFDLVGKGLDIPDLGDLVSGKNATEVGNVERQMEQQQSTPAPEPTSQAPTSMVRVPGAAA